jgi:DNA-binding NtrC family response regulator
VDLLFTDVVMPGEMDGIDLARRAQQLHPKLAVVLTSGFPDLRGADSRVASSHYRMLNKPYRHDELAHMIRQVLSESRHHRSHDAMATEPR